MKSITLLSTVFFLFCLFNINCQNKKKDIQNPKTPAIVAEVTTLQKAQDVFDRAKSLLITLEDSKDPYALKQIFPQTQIIPATYGNGWNFVPQGDFYILFLLPESQADYDKGCGKPAIMGTQKGNISGREILLVIFNPKFLQIANSEVFMDYLATAMLHESMHVFQWFVAQKTKVELPSLERERQAYLFQLEFLQTVLSKNHIGNVQIPKGIKIDNAKDIEKAAEKIDAANKYKLGPLATLVLYQHYLDQCLRFLTPE